MDILNSKKRTMKELMEYESVMEIPFFQREYVWSENKIIEFIDVFDQETPYIFLGVFIFRKKSKTTENGQSVLNIIDGQQRLISLSIIMLAMVSYLNSKYKETGNKNFTSEGIEKRIRDLLLIGRKEDVRFKLKTSSFFLNQNKEFCNLNKVLIDKIQEIKKDKRNSQVNLNFIKLVNYFDQNNFSRDRINKILEKIEYSSALGIKLEKEDAQEVFASLNFKGVPLIPSTLIFNELYSEDDDSCYKKLSSIQKNIRFGGDQSENIFFESVLTIYNQKDISNKKIFSSFEMMRDQEGEKNTIKIFQDYSVVFNDFFNHKDILKFREAYNLSNEEYSMIMFLQELKIKPIISIVLKILYLKKRTKNVFGLVDLLVNIESVFIIRSISGLRSSDFVVLSMLVLKKIEELFINDNINLVKVSEYVKNIVQKKDISNTIEIPKKDDFETDLALRDFYKMKHKMYILKRLEYYLSNTEEREILLKNGKGFKYSIEHIFPQNPGQEWIDKLGADEIKKMAEACHRIGNLTLLPKKFNGKVSNKYFDHKKNIPDIGYSSSKIELNKYFLKITRWDSKEIDSRSIKMAEYCLSLWGSIFK